MRNQNGSGTLNTNQRRTSINGRGSRRSKKTVAAGSPIVVMCPHGADHVSADLRTYESIGADLVLHGDRHIHDVRLHGFLHAYLQIGAPASLDLPWLYIMLSSELLAPESAESSLQRFVAHVNRRLCDGRQGLFVENGNHSYRCEMPVSCRCSRLAQLLGSYPRGDCRPHDIAGDLLQRAPINLPAAIQVTRWHWNSATPVNPELLCKARTALMVYESRAAWGLKHMDLHGLVNLRHAHERLRWMRGRLGSLISMLSKPAVPREVAVIR